jgi:hypothetical protein
VHWVNRRRGDHCLLSCFDGLCGRYTPTPTKAGEAHPGSSVSHTAVGAGASAVMLHLAKNNDGWLRRSQDSLLQPAFTGAHIVLWRVQRDLLPRRPGAEARAG